MWYTSSFRDCDQENAALDEAFAGGFHLTGDGVSVGNRTFSRAEYNILTPFGIRPVEGFVADGGDGRLYGVHYLMDEIRFTDISSGLMIGFAGRNTGEDPVPDSSVCELLDELVARVRSLPEEEYRCRVDYRRDMQRAGLYV